MYLKKLNTTERTTKLKFWGYADRISETVWKLRLKAIQRKAIKFLFGFDNFLMLVQKKRGPGPHTPMLHSHPWLFQRKFESQHFSHK